MLQNNLINIVKTEENLKGVIKKTPLINSKVVNNCKLFLKPENIQVTGSFKIRGAYNKISSLSLDERQKGVIACSAGNHAQGVAMSCKAFGIKCIICMPNTTPSVKIEATKSYGANVILVDGVYDDAYEKALELQKEYGYTFVHPFNDEKVIEGQGTIAYEILDELKDADIIVTSVGGGGLISGVSYVAKTINPNIKVYGVQASGAASMFMAYAKGYVDKLNFVNTFADGIAVKEVGNITLDYTKKYVDDIVTVSDEEISNAIYKLYTIDNLKVEGAGAASVAALLASRIPGINDDTKVVCILSGGNIDECLLSKIIGKNT